MSRPATGSEGLTKAGNPNWGVWVAILGGTVVLTTLADLFRSRVLG